MTDCRTFLITNASHVKKTKPPAMTIKSSHSRLLCAIKQAALLHSHQHKYKHATHFHSMHVTHKSSTPLQVYHLTVCTLSLLLCATDRKWPESTDDWTDTWSTVVSGLFIRFVHSEKTVEQCHLYKRHTQKLWSLALPNRTQRKTWPARPAMDPSTSWSHTHYNNTF